MSQTESTPELRSASDQLRPARANSNLGVTAFVAVTLFVASRPLRGTEYSGRINVVLTACVAVVAYRLLVRHEEVFAELRALGALALSLALFPILALAWTDPTESVVSSAATAADTLRIYAIGSILGLALLIDRLSPQVVRGLVAGGSMILLGNVLFSDLSGSVRDDWAGMYDQKNILGRLLALFAVFCLGLARSGRGHGVPRWFLVALWAAATAQVLYANSVGSAVGVVVGSAVVLVASRTRQPVDANKLLFRAGVGLIAIVGLLCFEVVFDRFLSGELNALFDRSTEFNTQNARESLWSLAASDIADRPVQGYGFARFDKGGRLILAGDDRVSGFDPGNAHNAYLELARQFGLPFLALFLLRSWRGLKATLEPVSQNRSLRLGMISCLGALGISYSLLGAGSARASIYWPVLLFFVWSGSRRRSSL